MGIKFFSGDSSIVPPFQSSESLSIVLCLYFLLFFVFVACYMKGARGRRIESFHSMGSSTFAMFPPNDDIGTITI